jgi:hypothetical protein
MVKGGIELSPSLVTVLAEQQPACFTVCHIGTAAGGQLVTAMALCTGLVMLRSCH